MTFKANLIFDGLPVLSFLKNTNWYCPRNPGPGSQVKVPFLWSSVEPMGSGRS